MTTYPLASQPDLLTSAALDARSRRALALARALRAVALNHGHTQHYLGENPDGLAGEPYMCLVRDERAWHDASVRAYRMLLDCLGISDDADESEDAETAFQGVLSELFGDGEGWEGNRV